MTGEDMILKICIVISAYFIVSLIGAYFIRTMLRRYEKELQIGGLKRAGMIIGILERIIILTLVLADQYTAISFIFTAKSIARFNELKNRKISEYYLIGTLLSMAFAMIIGVITRVIIGKVI